MKALKISIESLKFMGSEPMFPNGTVTVQNRKTKLMLTLNWFNYNFSFKDAHAFVVEYLKVNDRKDEAKLFKKAALNSVTNASGFLARMSQTGWVLTDEESADLETAIANAIKDLTIDVEDSEPKKSDPSKLNIQERMREIAAEAGGEVEGLIDTYIASGCPRLHKLSPINKLKAANMLPAHVAPEIEHFTRIRQEYIEVQKATDEDLVEGYSNFNKVQIRNLIKFLETIISDYASYVTFKKSTKAKPRRRVKTPEQLVYKLKYRRQDLGLKISSVDPTKIIGATEIFAFNTKTRKLIHIIADDHAGNSLTVKNSTIQGFDATKTLQKTIRKPEVQLKVFMAAGLQKKRKLFDDNKTVEIKFNGRFNENILILKVT